MSVISHQELAAKADSILAFSNLVLMLIPIFGVIALVMLESEWRLLCAEAAGGALAVALFMKVIGHLIHIRAALAKNQSKD